MDSIIFWRERLIEILEQRSDEFLDELARARHKISPKAVHDLRVASRRALAVLEMADVCLGNNEVYPLKKKIKKIMKMLSALRDVHIQKEYIAEMLVVFHQLTPYYKTLRLQEKKLLKKVTKRISKYKMREFRKLFDKFMASLVDALADEGVLLYKQALTTRKVDDTFSLLIQRKRELIQENASTMHRFRVALKKFRYQMEIMVVLSAADSNIVEEMHIKQTKLGNIQDLRIIACGLSLYGKKNGKIGEATKAILDEFNRKINHLVNNQIAEADEIYRYWDYADLQTKSLTLKSISGDAPIDAPCGSSHK